ncbi:HAD family hydrolase [Brevibacillus brevis]|nr:HAD hydrolase-like protein [Brevibacillus brevis]
MKLDVLFLDFDGTVMEDKFRHYECYSQIMENFRCKPLDLDVYWNLKRNKRSLRDILKKSNFTEEETIFYQEWVKRIETKKYLKYAQLKPKVKETLIEWRKLCHKIILVSMRSSLENLVWQTKKESLYESFDEIRSCSPFIKHGKYNILSEYSFSTGIFIGDSEEDMVPAKMLGLKTIAVTNGIRDKKYLIADYYAEELFDVELEKIIKLCTQEGEEYDSISGS